MVDHKAGSTNPGQGTFPPRVKCLQETSAVVASPETYLYNKNRKVIRGPMDLNKITRFVYSVNE